MSVVKLAVLFGGVPAAILVGVTVLMYLPSLFSRRRRAERGQTTVPAKRDPVAREANRPSTAAKSVHSEESDVAVAH